MNIITFFVSLVLLVGSAVNTFAQKPQVDLGLLKATVAQWSEAHNTQDKGPLRNCMRLHYFFTRRRCPGQNVFK